jgi:2-haloacid dehalogenase
MKKSVLVTTIVLCIGLLSPISFPAPAMAQPIKAVLTDSYGTIVSWEGVETAVADVLHKKGSTADPKAFNGAWRLRQLLYSQWNTIIGRGFEPFIFLTRKALRTTAAIYKVELTKADEDLLVGTWDKLEPYPDVIEGLKRIKKLGYLIGPITNGNEEMVRIGLVDRFAERGVKFDVYFTADMWGKNKPHPDIYLKSLEKMGLKPQEVIFATRVQLDVQGAKAVGLKVAWVNRAGEPLEQYGYKPDWEVKDFLELAKFLEEKRP